MQPSSPAPAASRSLSQSSVDSIHAALGGVASTITSSAAFMLGSRGSSPLGAKAPAAVSPPPIPSPSSSIEPLTTKGIPSSLEEERALKLRRQSRAYTASPTFALEDHDLLVRRLESGIEQRDVLLAQERERHHSEMSSLTKRLLEAEEREAALHKDLLIAKQDSVALEAAQRRISELARSNESSMTKLTSLNDASQLNQQKHDLLTDSLEAERKGAAALREELDAARAELLRVKEQASEFQGHVFKLEQQRKKINASQLADWAMRYLVRVERTWAFTFWMQRAHQQRKVERILSRTRTGILVELSTGFRRWMEVTKKSKVISKLNLKADFKAQRFRRESLYRAWTLWTRATDVAMRNLLRGRQSTLQVDISQVTLELKELHATCHAQEVALTKSLEAISGMEVIHREERGHLEVKVVELTESLQAKRETCEKLRRAKMHVIAQFEAAEAEFLEAERRRKDSSVVGRVIDAVFGESTVYPASMQQLVNADRHGDPVDRMSLVGETYHSSHKARPRKARPAAIPPTTGTRRPHSFPNDFHQHESHSRAETHKFGAGSSKSLRSKGLKQSSTSSWETPLRIGESRRKISPRSSEAAADLVERARIRAQRELQL